MSAALDALMRLLGPSAVFRGSQGMALCPCHEDRKPSLSFRVGTRRPVVAKCHACQARLPEILEKLGASEEDRRLIMGSAKPTDSGTAYIYRDENSVPLFRVLRIGKSFPQERYEAGEWIPRLDGARRVPYRVPEVLGAISRGETLYIPEGEKDVETLVALGLASTCNPGGAKKWLPEYTELLSGARQVVVLEDNDEPGRVHARRVAESFRSKGVPDVRIVSFPELPEHGDVSDWMARLGGSNEEKRSALINRVESAGGMTATTGPEPAGQGKALVFEDLVPWGQPVDVAEILTELVATLGRFMVLPVHAATTIALWIVFTYTLDAARCSPRLFLTSPQRECGKSRLLGLIRVFAWRPLPSASVTPAAFYRVVDGYLPTLLLDEFDNARLADNPDLRAVLNTGHTRGIPILRTVGEDHCVKHFSAWAAVALAGIGRLPDTMMSRAIVVGMQRRKKSEKFERLRESRLFGQMAPVRRRILRWAKDNLEVLRVADPECPESLSDRAADNWEPLFAIADLASGPWPKRARDAALAISGIAVSDDTDGVRLLDAVRAAPFTEDGKLSSEGLVQYLFKLRDQRWGEWNKGRPISMSQVARLLGPFGIAPDSIRIGDRTVKGYTRDQFTDAWERYGAPAGGTPEHDASGAVETAFMEAEHGVPCSVPENGTPANNGAGCSVVPVDELVQRHPGDGGPPNDGSSCRHCGGRRVFASGGVAVCFECHRLWEVPGA